MISKYLDTSLLAILSLILICAPTQYSFNVGNAHLSAADPLIWLGGLLFCISAAARILFSKSAGIPFKERLFAYLKEILPLPENILFVVLISFSFFKAESMTDSAKELFQVVEYVVVAFILFSKIKWTDKMLERTAVLFLSLVSVVVLIAVFQYFDASAGIMKVKGSFGNRNTYGGFLAVTLPLILSIILQAGNWRMKIWGLLILAAAGMTVLSGGAAFGLLFAGSLICVSISRRAFLIWVAVIAVSVVFVLPKLPRDNVEVLKQSVRIFDEDGHVESRYTEWQASVQMWSEQPLLGVGLGNYQSQIGMNYGFLAIKEGPKEQDHNNLFLVFGSSTGLIGLLGLLTMLTLWFQRTAVSFFSCKSESKSFHCGYQRILALGAMGAIAAFCVTSIWTALLVRGVFLFFVIIAAMAVNYSKQCLESKE
ncbi:MAG: O-antigen ligase family protein [Victivallales bacterium]|jgi:O-antigen ligase